jgi:hypothetical protein
MGFSGGSADSETSLNRAIELRGGSPGRWGRAHWIGLGLALLPLVVLALVALLV